MGKKIFKRLIIAASLILIGSILFVGAMTMLNWNFKELSGQYETNSYEFTESFKNISITTDTADIVFAPSTTDSTNIICYEQQNEKHLVEINNDTLLINTVESKKWYQYIGFNFKTPKITIYLPIAQYEKLYISESTGNIEIPSNFTFLDIDVSTSTGHINTQASALQNIKLKASTGDILLQDMSAASLDLTVSTGKITASNIKCDGDIKTHVSTGKTYLTNITCNKFTSSGNTGDMHLQNVIAAQKFDITRSTGDVNFDRCDAAELLITTSTGDVKGTLLSDKVFIIKTSTGETNVPESLTGGKCKITTDTGDINIEIAH